MKESSLNSLNGDPVHTETVTAMLRKIGLHKGALKCGMHKPYSPEATQQLRQQGAHPSVLHNNCSGKHAGMLALALHFGATTDTYEEPAHPVQLNIARAIARFSDVPVEDIAIGVDGCGVPAFGITLRAMALMYARLVVPPASFDDHIFIACRRIVSAMLAHPEMIGGMTESLDTALMRAERGRLLAKAGAEGLFTAGILPCERWPRGLGVALKIEDGDKERRARGPVVVESLRQFGVLNDATLEAVASYARSPVYNNRHEVVGKVLASFKLKIVER